MGKYVSVVGKYSKPKTRANYILDKLTTKSGSTNAAFKVSLGSLDKFCSDYFDVDDFDVVIQDVLKMEPEQREDEIVSIIQEWVNFLAKSKVFNTIKVMLSAITKYLKYYKIKIIFNDEIEYPQNIQEEKYPISREEIQRILDVADFKQKGYYLCLISSGSRPVEIIGLKKKYIFWTGTRFGAKIPARLTKKKMARTTFFSVECNQYLSTLLKKHDDEETIFTKNPILKNARGIEGQILQGYLRKLGMDYKFETTGKSKINLYCFRGYFFTKAIRILNVDIAHAMIGHSGYMQTYQTRTDEEKEELFIDIEPEILIFDQTKNIEKIKRLTEANKKVDALTQKLDEEKEARLQAEKETKMALAKFRVQLLKNSS